MITTERFQNWLQRRQRLSRARHAYRARTRQGLALPGRHPRLAYLFAIIPILAVVVLLAASPFLYNIDKRTKDVFDTTPVSQQIAASAPEEGGGRLPSRTGTSRIGSTFSWSAPTIARATSTAAPTR